MTIRRRVACLAAGSLVVWAVLLAVGPRAHQRPTPEAGRHPVSHPGAMPAPSTAGPAAPADRVVVILDTASWSHPRPDAAALAGLLTAAEARQLIASPPVLTAAQVGAGVTETPRIVAESVEAEGTGRAQVWVDAVVTITSPGHGAEVVPAPVVAEVVRVGGTWLVDGMGTA
ncbi:MAG: hypothetical protein ACYCS2_04415 [Acidimicrobiales bacterium]